MIFVLVSLRLLTVPFVAVPKKQLLGNADILPILPYVLGRSRRQQPGRRTVDDKLPSKAQYLIFSEALSGPEGPVFSASVVIYGQERR